MRFMDWMCGRYSGAYLGTMIPARYIPGAAATLAAFALVNSRAALLINGTRQIICFILKNRCQHVVGVEAPPDTPVSTTETTIGGSEPVATIAWQLFDIGFKRPLFSVKLQEMNLFFGIPSV